MAILAMRGFDDATPESPDLAGGPMGQANSRTGVGGSQYFGGSGLYSCAFPAGNRRIVGVGVTFDNFNPGVNWLYLREGGTNHLYLSWDGNVAGASGGHIRLLRGDGTVLATATMQMILNVWMYVEIDALIDDVNGSVTLYINGNVALTYSGDTRNGATGVIDNMALQGGFNGAQRMYADDLYVDDSVVRGDIVVRTLLPNGNGSSSQWVNSAGNSINNSTYVDEANSSMTDYVAASVSGTSDLYALTDIPANYNVLAVQEVIYAVKSDAGVSPVVLPQAKGQLGGVRTDTALPALTTTALAYNGDIQTTDPDGNPLTPATVNAMEIGAKIQ